MARPKVVGNFADSTPAAMRKPAGKEMSSAITSTPSPRTRGAVGPTSVQTPMREPTITCATEMARMIHIAFPRVGWGTLSGEEAPPASWL
jgi:hypothetical protein